LRKKGEIGSSTKNGGSRRRSITGMLTFSSQLKKEKGRSQLAAIGGEEAREEAPPPEADRKKRSSEGLASKGVLRN